MFILLYEEISSSIIEKIKELGHEIYDISKDRSDEEELLKKCEVIIVKSKVNLNKELISKAKNLKYIIKGGVGIDNIDVDFAHNLGIHVLNTPDAPIISVAEYVMGLIIAVSRKVIQSNYSIKIGNFESDQFKGIELYGKILGLVGFGRIGREVAKRALTFSMKVIACDKYLSNSPMPGVPLMPLNQLLPQADIISFHLTFDPKKDKPIIQQEQIDLMKNNVILINCAKNGIIDDNSFIKAVKEGKIGGAAIDVVNYNSNLISELKDMQNIIFTSNIASKTFETEQRISEHIYTIIKGLGQK